MTCHGSRLKRKQTCAPVFKTHYYRAVTTNKKQVCTTIRHCPSQHSASTRLHFDGEALIKTECTSAKRATMSRHSQSLRSASLCSQEEVALSKMIWLWNLFSNACGFRGSSTSLSLIFNRNISVARDVKTSAGRKSISALFSVYRKGFLTKALIFFFQTRRHTYKLD